MVKKKGKHLASKWAMEKTDTWGISSMFEGTIKCVCGQVQTLEGLADHAKCTNCGKDLTKELF